MQEKMAKELKTIRSNIIERFWRDGAIGGNMLECCAMEEGVKAKTKGKKKSGKCTRGKRCECTKQGA